MNLEKLKKPTDWFTVVALRSIEDPAGKVDRKELVVSLDQYPCGFSYGPNPRRPDPTSRVSKEIRDSLRENGSSFHLLNRGITIVAKKLDFDNKNDRARLHLHEDEEEERFFGILDGGNTNERINDYRENLPEEGADAELKSRFVNVQILVPRAVGSELSARDFETLLNDIKEARNSSVQVKQKSLADARRHFDDLKRILANEPFFDEITWREGEKGQLDAQQILVLFMTFYPSFCKSGPDGEPSNAYGRREKCLTAFLEFSESEPEELGRWLELLPVMLRLFDEIQYEFPDLYSGVFGKIREVQIFDEQRYEKGGKKYRKTPATTQFFGREMKYQYPTGWIYPIFAALRALAGPNSTGDAILWKREPIQFWKDHAQVICSRYEAFLRDVGYEPKKVATSSICFSSMRGVVTELFKDELLKEAGIEA